MSEFTVTIIPTEIESPIREARVREWDDVARLVGGFIEVVHVPEPLSQNGEVLMLVNEDGVRLRLPINGRATAFYPGVIRGVAVLIRAVDEEYVSISDADTPLTVLRNRMLDATGQLIIDTFATLDHQMERFAVLHRRG